MTNNELSFVVKRVKTAMNLNIDFKSVKVA